MTDDTITDRLAELDALTLDTHPHEARVEVGVLLTDEQVESDVMDIAGVLKWVAEDAFSDLPAAAEVTVRER